MPALSPTMQGLERRTWRPNWLRIGAVVFCLLFWTGAYAVARFLVGG